MLALESNNVWNLEGLVLHWSWDKGSAGVREFIISCKVEDNNNNNNNNFSLIIKLDTNTE